MKRLVTILAVTMVGTALAAAAAVGGVERGSATSPGVVTAAKAYVAKWSTPLAPTISAKPFKPVSGKKVGILVCGYIAPPCLRMADEAEKAAKLLGWTTVRVDGKLTPPTWTAAMDQLTRQKVDGIISIVASDQATPSAHVRTAKAKVVVVCVVCANKGAAPIKNPSAANADADYFGQGVAIANFAIAQTNGKARVAIFDDQLAIPVALRMKGVRATLKKCADCKVVFDEELGQSQDLLAESRRITDSVLQQHPKGELDFIIPPSDTQAVGPSQSLRANKRDDVKVIAFDCELASLANIRAGKYEQMCVNTPLAWLGWAGIDQMARIFGGLPASSAQTPYQIITKANAPGPGKFVEGFDFRGYYAKLWGKK